MALTWVRIGNLKGPMGPAGDAAAMGRFQAIEATLAKALVREAELSLEDLDDLRTQGIYPQRLNGNATAQRHYPEAARGVLTVHRLNDTLRLQIYVSAASGKTYVRQWDGGAWGGWHDSEATAEEALKRLPGIEEVLGRVPGIEETLKRLPGIEEVLGRVPGIEEGLGRALIRQPDLGGTDLDAIRVQGVYPQGESAQASLDLHYPEPSRGTLLVHRVNDYARAQTYLSGVSGKTYSRQWDGANWGSWYDPETRANEALGRLPDVESAAAKIPDIEARTPKLTESDGWLVRDNSGAVALQVTRDGSTIVGRSDFRVLDDNSPYSFLLRDVSGAVALAVDHSGQVVFGGGVSQMPEMHVFIGAGQSNMSGRGTPAGDEYDPVDSRILQYGARKNSMGTITPATVPLDMHDAPGGLSPLTAFAREYLKTQPANVSVLLVPAAHGGTAFYTSSETPLPTGYAPPNTGGGTWQYNRAEPVNLYQRMVAQTKAALAAVVSQLGTTPKLKGFLWHQGEGDAGRTDQAGYAGHFDALVTDLRTQLNAPTLPIVLGGMSPDMIATTPSMLPIHAAQVDTPRRLTHSGFARAERETGKYNDVVHFGREGVELLGRSYLEAYKRALANVSTSSPMPPRNVRASYFGGVLNMQFDYPLCRATSFAIEYSMDGGPWVTIPRTVGMDYEASITGIAGGVAKVRVSTINEVGTSAPSTPITASGA